jgi:hypothetical protein
VLLPLRFLNHLEDANTVSIEQSPKSLGETLNIARALLL